MHNLKSHCEEHILSFKIEVLEFLTVVNKGGFHGRGYTLLWLIKSACVKGVIKNTFLALGLIVIRKQ